jgi:hypothetical protein
MNLYKALMKMKSGETLSSEKCMAVKQSKESILFWLLSPEHTLSERMKNLIEYSETEDWEIIKK